MRQQPEHFTFAYKNTFQQAAIKFARLNLIGYMGKDWNDCSY